LTVELKWEERSVVATFMGSVSDEDIFGTQARVHGHPEFDSLKFVISDLLGIEGVSIVPNTFMLAGAYDCGASLTNPHIKYAFVTEDGSVRDLVEVYIQTLQKLDVTWDVRQFYSMDSARKWASSK
jgi:hypothetical protein